MREPSIQTKLLASPPVFFGSWALAALSVYGWSQHPDSWPMPIWFGLLVTAVMKADEQVRAYKAWRREWDAMAGLPPPRRKWPQLVGALLALPLLSLLLDAHQHGGGQEVAGVLLLLIAPIVVIAGLVRLWRWVHRRARRRARDQYARIACKRPLLPVPPLVAAYHALPPYCQQLRVQR